MLIQTEKKEVTLKSKFCGWNYQQMNSANKHKRFSFYQSFKKRKTYFLLIVLFGINFQSYSQKIDPDGYNKFYYKNGAVASEGQFAAGVPVGEWITYYEDGTIKSKGIKTNGLSDSTWLFFDNQGRLIWKYEYQNDKKNGCAQRFDSLGYLIEEFYYVDDVVQGEKQWYYQDGSLKKSVNIENGKESGIAYEYAPDGTIITEEEYENGFLKNKETFNRLDENGNKTGVWRAYYPDGTLQSEITYKDGQKYGLSKIYNKKGKLIELSDMTSDSTNTKGDVGILNLYKEYYPGGNIKLVGGLQDSLKHGIYRLYDQNGEIINGYIYERDTLVAEGMILADGTYDSTWKEFYFSGQLRAEGFYQNGIKEGKWTYFYPNGKKEQTGNYKKDTPSGTWTWYYQNGQAKRIETYNAYGKLQGLMTEYDSLGNEIAHGEYYNGIQEGAWFYHVGDHKEVGTFSQGRQTGMWQHFYLNGKLAYSGEYDDGDPKGKHVWYHTNGIKKMSGKYVGGVKHGVWRTYDKMGEVIEEILYKNGEIIKINGFKVRPAEDPEV